MTTAMLGDRLVIANDVAELRRIAQWLRDSAAEAGIPQELVVLLDHCANEAVVNIISYAYDDRRRHDISLELNRTVNGARLVIRDDGKPFNVLDVPERKPPQSLDESKVGGLGIYLIRRLMSRCDYRRDDGMNVLSLEARHTVQPGNV